MKMVNQNLKENMFMEKNGKEKKMEKISKENI